MRQIGKLYTRKTENGIQYRVYFHCLDSELSSIATNVGAVFPYGSGAFVSEYEVQAAGTNEWLVKIEGKSNDYTSGSKNAKEILASYNMSFITIPPEQIGIRRATKTDVDAGVYTTLLGNSSVLAKVNDWIFANYTTEDLVGTPSVDKSPFALISGTELSTDTCKQIVRGVKFPVLIYSVKYAGDSNDEKNFAEFIGVNGSFPSALTPEPSSTNYWKANGQTLQKVTINGDDKIVVNRSCMSAPFKANLKWNPEANGGEWTWGASPIPEV